MRTNESLKNTIIIILILIIIGLSSMSIYFSLDDKDNVNSNNNDIEISEESTEMSVTEKKYFMDVIIHNLDKAQYTSREYDKNSLSNLDKIKFAFVVRDEEVNSYEYLVSISQKYLGKKGSFNPENVECNYDDGLLYQYDLSQNVFVAVGNHGHGATEPSFDVVNNFIDGKIISEDGEIKLAIIKMHKSFSSLCKDVCGYDFNRYGTFEDAEKEVNAVKNFTNIYNNDKENYFINEEKYIIEDLEDNAHKYPVHTYTFEYKDENYYLKSISID